MKKGLAGLFALLFMLMGLFACNDNSATGEVTVYMPDGAPALALAGMMAEDTEKDGVSYYVTSASLIASKVTNKDAEKNADICVMPVTAASKLLGTGEAYTMLGVVTHGNLYLIAKENFVFTGLNDLIGKVIGVLQINEVPGLTLKAVLDKENIAWQELTNGGAVVEDKVNLLAITGAEAVGTVEADCYMIAEPAASAQSKKGYGIIGDLQALYGGEGGYPQAVLLAKKELVATQEAWVKDFAAQVEESAEWLKTANGTEIAESVSAHMEDKSAATSLKAQLLTAEVISRCGVRFAYAADSAVQVQTFLTRLRGIKEGAAAIPAEKFYWVYKK